MKESVSMGADFGGTFAEVDSLDARTGNLVVQKFLTSKDASRAISGGMKSIGRPGTRA